MSGLARYRLGQLLGRGGMGEVYRAFDTTLHRDVAIKLVRTESPRDRARLLREARSAASIDHPHAVVIYDVSEASDDTAFIVMELLHGKTLAARAAEGPVPAATALGWLRDVASALAAAHARGIVHRDVKPSNIVIGDDGTAKVLDFGIARRAGLQPLLDTGEAPPLETGGVAGTPAYMAPEQTAGIFDARSDQYAWAVTAYELLCGVRPGPDQAAWPAEVPPRAAAAISRALSSARDRRWPTMRAVIRELDAARAVRPACRARRTARWALALGGAAAATGIAIAVWPPSASPPLVPTRARCRIAARVPVTAPPDAAIDIATCGGPVLVTASHPAGALHAVTALDAPVALAPPTGRAAGAPGALAACDHDQLRVVFWSFEPSSAQPFVAGVVKPGADPCDEPDRFCARPYPVGRQTACALALGEPIDSSLLGCLDADPASAAIGLVQLGHGRGGRDLALVRQRPAQLAATSTEIDDAAAIAARDGDRIRLGWYLLGGEHRYQTIATGVVGEPALVAQGRAVLVVWPARAAGRWVLHAAAARPSGAPRGDLPTVEAVATGDPPTATAAPSLVAHAGGLAIAWLADAAGTLKVGLGADLAGAIGNATVVATGARSPRLAAGGGSLVAAWSDAAGPTLARVDCSSP